MKSYDRLSERQRSILRYMEQYIDQNGFPPTIREIGLATDINSTSVVNYNLNKLVQAGYLTRSGRVSRGLRLVGKGDNEMRKIAPVNNGLRVPMVGHIVASEPVAIPEDAGHYYDQDSIINVTPDMLGGADPALVFALRVKGDSMIDAMVADGDIVLLRKQETAKQGDMVAVWLDENGETTLKLYYPEGERVRLQPKHPHMAPIYVDARHCHVRGKVLTVIRRVN
ncbi:MAG: repressor LexA [Chloroflexi bacterium]|nr:repressor LexA [Chloroflexota bacterium]